MYRINKFIVTIIQLILLIDDTQHSKIKSYITAIKTMTKMIKTPKKLIVKDMTKIGIKGVDKVLETGAINKSGEQLTAKGSKLSRLFDIKSHAKNFGIWLGAAIAQKPKMPEKFRNQKRMNRDEFEPKVTFTDQSLLERLTTVQYDCTQFCDTENIATGIYNHHADPGIYSCIICDDHLFNSEEKSKDGFYMWPNFWGGVQENMVEFLEIIYDKKGKKKGERHELGCKNCGSHIGFKTYDGPKHLGEGQRFITNSASLTFTEIYPPGVEKEIIPVHEG